MALEILKPLEQLNHGLQSASATVSEMLKALSEVRSYIEGLRSDERFEQILNEGQQQIAALNLDALQLPRKRRPPAKFCGPADAFNAHTVAEYFRIEFYKVIDCCLSQLAERFSSSVGLKRYTELESVLISGHVCDAASLYPELGAQGELQLEMEMLWKSQKMDFTGSTVNLDLYVNKLRNLTPEVRALFPHVEALVRLLLVNPASSASAERSFSSLRRLKTYLRSSMGQIRLNNVALCHVHKDMLDTIEADVIMRKFIESKENRIIVFGKLGS
jgi:hypothetical protein